MKKSSATTAALLLATALCASACSTTRRTPIEPEDGFASGVVFHDRNRDGVRGRFEFGIRGVAVSNGREVVRTDRHGRYRLPIDGEAIIFVVKPTGFATAIGENQLPLFYYNHKPDGSPENLRFPGVAPTGPLPASIDFPLTRQREPGRFDVLLFGDPQP